MRMRVVIAEDAALLREGLTRLLEDRGHVISAAVSDGDALLAAVAEHRPDVTVVDIRMPPTHTDEGLRAALKLRQDFPGTGVLMFSQYIETSYSAQLLEGGAAGVGYLLKDRVADVAEFSAALERVADGGTALDPEVVSQLFRASRQRGGLATLTPRERQVLALMAGPTPGSAPSSWSRAARWRSTWPASSPSSACLPVRATTAGSWPCCATWAPEGSAALTDLANQISFKANAFSQGGRHDRVP
jgi:DNA-binding NarL/FixJ family response regulator